MRIDEIGAIAIAVPLRKAFSGSGCHPLFPGMIGNWPMPKSGIETAPAPGTELQRDRDPIGRYCLDR